MKKPGKFQKKDTRRKRTALKSPKAGKRARKAVKNLEINMDESTDLGIGQAVRQATASGEVLVTGHYERLGAQLQGYEVAPQEPAPLDEATEPQPELEAA